MDIKMRDEIYAADRNKEEQWVARVCLYKFTPFLSADNGC